MIVLATTMPSMFYTTLSWWNFPCCQKNSNMEFPPSSSSEFWLYKGLRSMTGVHSYVAVYTHLKGWDGLCLYSDTKDSFIIYPAPDFTFVFGDIAIYILTRLICCLPYTTTLYRPVDSKYSSAIFFSGNPYFDWAIVILFDSKDSHQFRHGSFPKTGRSSCYVYIFHRNGGLFGSQTLEGRF